MWVAKCVRPGNDPVVPLPHHSHGSFPDADTLLMLFNSHYEPVPFVLPELKPKQQWQLLLDTREGMIRQFPPTVPHLGFARLKDLKLGHVSVVFGF